MKRYRSGHNGTASKAAGHNLWLVGSNPTLFAKIKECLTLYKVRSEDI